MSSRSGVYQLAFGDTLQAYDLRAQFYDYEDHPLHAATAWVLDRVPLGAADALVLELGCGTGRNVARVLAEGARGYLGVDGSLGMLSVANGRFHDPRVSFTHADLMTPWTLEQQVDLALLVLVLEHLPTLDALAQTLAHVVRPGGRVRIVDVHPERIANGAVESFHDGERELVFASIAHNVLSICDVLDAAGFDVVRRDWLASDALATAVPAMARLRGLRAILDIKGTRRVSTARGTGKQDAMKRD